MLSPRQQVLSPPVQSHMVMSSSPSWTFSAPTEVSPIFAMHLEHLQDVIAVMMRQERHYYGEARNSTNATWKQRQQYPSVNQQRSSLVQWMSSVVDVFQLAPQIVATGMYFLDRSASILSMGSQSSTCDDITTSLQYPLLAMTCLELAIKMHDTKLFPLMELTKMGPVRCTISDIVAMEGILMQYLQWKLNPPTPHCFIHQYGVLLDGLLRYHYQVPSLANYVPRIVKKAIGLVRLCLYDGTISPAVAGYAAFLAALEDPTHPLPTACKQDFCLYMMNLTGLSASSTGLVQAYQLLSMGTSSYGGANKLSSMNMMMSPDVSHSSSNTQSRGSDDPGLQQQVASPTYVGSTTTTTGYLSSQFSQIPRAPSLDESTDPVIVVPRNGQPLDVPIGRQASTSMKHDYTNRAVNENTNSYSSLSYANTMTTTTSSSSLVANTMTNAQRTMSGASSRGSNRAESDSIISTHGYKNNNSNHPRPQPPTKREMIYSAGDDLGFEVTLNPFDDENRMTRKNHHQHHPDNKDCSQLTKTLESLSLDGWSPRDVIGA